MCVARFQPGRQVILQVAEGVLPFPALRAYGDAAPLVERLALFGTSAAVGAIGIAALAVGLLVLATPRSRECWETAVLGRMAHNTVMAAILVLPICVCFAILQLIGLGGDRDLATLTNDLSASALTIILFDAPDSVSATHQIAFRGAYLKPSPLL